MFRILLTEDNKHDYQIAKVYLEKNNPEIEITWAKNKKEFDALIDPGKFDIVVLDMNLPDATGLEIIAGLQEKEIDLPVVFVTGSSNIQIAVEAMQIGATDFMVKDAEGEYLKILPDVLRRALQTWQSKKAAERAEQERLQNQERFQALFEKNNDGIFLLDLEENYIAVNEHAANLLGYSVDEFVNLTTKDIVAPDEYEESSRRIQELLAGKTLPIYERQFRRKDGSLFIVEVNMSLVSDGQGNPSHLQSIVRDITERKQQEIALVEQKQLFEQLVQVAQSVSKSPGLQETFKNILQTAQSLTDTELGSIFLLDEDRKVTHSLIARETEYKVEKKVLIEEIMEHGLMGWVAKNQIPALIPDTEKDERWYSFQEPPYDIRSALAMPILLHGNLIGVLNLMHSQLGHFTEQHHNILLSASNQIALALSNAKIFEEQRQLTERQTTLLETLHHLGETHDPLHLAQIAIDTIKKFTRWNFTSLVLADDLETESMKTFQVAGWHGTHENMIQNTEQGIIGRAYRTGEIQVTQDVSKDPDYFLGTPSTKSEIAVPLKRDGNVFGIFDIQSDQLNGFEDQDILLAESLGDVISLAFSNAFLFEEQTQLTNRQRTLYETLQQLGEQHELKTLTKTAVETIKKLTNWDYIGLLVLENTPGWPKKKIVAYYQGLEFDAISEIASGKGITRRAIDSMQTQIILNVANDPDYVGGKSGTQSELIAPFKSGSQIVGVLDIASEQLNAFTRDDVLLAESLTEAISLAVTNAALFEEIQANAERLKEFDRLKSTFLASMSHEIRTPLNAIIGMSSLIESDTLSPNNRESLEIIRSSSALLLNLINDILDFSKIEADKLELETITFDLKECIDETLRVITPKTKEKGLILDLKYDDHTPDLIAADKTRLQQILLNLLNNATKFTNSGGITLSITTNKNASPHKDILFTITDTGIGIPEDRVNILFEPFNQMDASTTRRYGGTGLGLAISKRLSKLMGGDIWVESETGKGSTFYFNIIVEEVSELDQEKIIRSIRPDQDQISKPLSDHYFETFADLGSKHPLRIILAEDNLVNQKVALRTLERLGYTAKVAKNGLEVLEHLEKDPYDLILMDIQMPEMDGWETTQKIRANPSYKDFPQIVALTAHALKEDKEKSFTVGMNAYIQKPFDIAKLVEVLNECKSSDRE